IWRGPMLGKMLDNFFKEVEGGELDYLLLDLPPGTGDVAMNIHEMLPTAHELIVTTPHPTAAFVAARASQRTFKYKQERHGSVENMSKSERKETGKHEYVFGQGAGDKLAEQLQSKVLGRLSL